MASSDLCNVCSDGKKLISATKYCSDCDERICTDCAEAHDRFEAFKPHHVIDLSAVGSIVPISGKKSCNIHPEMLLDYYCKDHDIICCRACISTEHWVCENILPLEIASKNVKESALCTEVIQDIKHIFATLNDLKRNRQSNLLSLVKTNSEITYQFVSVKSQLLKQIDDIEYEFQSDLSSLQRKHEKEINKQEDEISDVLETVKAIESEIEFTKKHGSNNKLFIALCLLGRSRIQSAEAKVQQLISKSQELYVTFDAEKDIKFKSLGSLFQNAKSCEVKYKPRKIKQAQILAEPAKRIIGFEENPKLRLTTEVHYNLIDLCVTYDDKLLLTNNSVAYPNIYVYRNCQDYEKSITFSSPPRSVALMPGTERAVVTLPDEQSIQFINTSKMTKGDKINVGFTCYCITAAPDKLYVGGEFGTIKTLDIFGSIQNKIHQQESNVYFMKYSSLYKQLIVRCFAKLLCTELNGALLYSNNVSGVSGVALDRQNNMFVGGYKTCNIQRMSSDVTTCEEMLTKDDNIDRPFGISFNSDFTKLYVISNQFTSVSVYTCKLS